MVKKPAAWPGGNPGLGGGMLGRLVPNHGGAFFFPGVFRVNCYVAVTVL